MSKTQTTALDAGGEGYGVRSNRRGMDWDTLFPPRDARSALVALALHVASPRQEVGYASSAGMQPPSEPSPDRTWPGLPTASWRELGNLSLILGILVALPCP